MTSWISVVMVCTLGNTLLSALLRTVFHVHPHTLRSRDLHSQGVDLERESQMLTILYRACSYQNMHSIFALPSDHNDGHNPSYVKQIRSVPMRWQRRRCVGDFLKALASLSLLFDDVHCSSDRVIDELRSHHDESSLSSYCDRS